MWQKLINWWWRPGPTSEQPKDASETPKLDQVLSIIRAEVIRQATQEGGPDPDNVFSLVVTGLDNDPLLKRVLETKGYEMRFVVRMGLMDVMAEPDTNPLDVPLGGWPKQQSGDYAHESNKNPWG